MMVLTRRGWTLATIALAAIVGGRMLGVLELFITGIVAAALLLLAVMSVALTRLNLQLNREIHPPRIHAGSPSRVDVDIANRGPRRTPVLRLDDAVEGTPGAQLLVGPLHPGERTAAAYRLPTDRRGIIEVGPLEVVVSDPFDLSRARLEGADITELTVYPSIEQILPPPHTTADDPHAGADHPNVMSRSGEDFYALRPYVVGDDLRRVHWGATAHHDALMVRQDELPWQGRVTVLVDIRHQTSTADSLELCVSAAASVVHASWRRQDLIRLVSTDGTDSGHAAGHAHVDAIMEHLATLTSVDSGGFRSSIDALARSGTGGALVAIVSELPAAELDSLLRLRSRFGWLAILKFERSSYVPAAAVERRSDRDGVLRITRDHTFQRVWDTHVAPRTGPAIPAHIATGSPAPLPVDVA